MLEGCGFEVINLGVDVSSDQFVEAAPETPCRHRMHVGTADYHHELYAGGHSRYSSLGPRAETPRHGRRCSVDRGFCHRDRSRRIQLQCKRRRNSGPPPYPGITMEQAEIPFADLPFDRTEVCRGLGITQASAPGQFEILLDEAISEAARRCRPQYAYRLFRRAVDPDSISAAGKIRNGTRHHRYLKNAEYLAFFLATAGRGIRRMAPGAQNGRRHSERIPDPMPSGRRSPRPPPGSWPGG